jgi:cytochrome bd-type quinol oxidase subunit 1
MFSAIYLMLLILYLYILVAKVRHGPDEAGGKEVAA